VSASRLAIPVDLTAAYASYLAAETDEPTPRDIAVVRTPPDMFG